MPVVREKQGRAGVAAFALLLASRGVWHRVGRYAGRPADQFV